MPRYENSTKRSRLERRKAKNNARGYVAGRISQSRKHKWKQPIRGSVESTRGGQPKYVRRSESKSGGGTRSARKPKSERAGTPYDNTIELIRSLGPEMGAIQPEIARLMADAQPLLDHAKEYTRAARADIKKHTAWIGPWVKQQSMKAMADAKKAISSMQNREQPRSMMSGFFPRARGRGTTRRSWRDEAKERDFNRRNAKRIKTSPPDPYKPIDWGENWGPPTNKPKKRRRNKKNLFW